MDHLFFGRGAGASDSSYVCSSIDDIETRLRGVLSTKIAPTRAEHVNVTLSIHPSTPFIITEPPSRPNPPGLSDASSNEDADRDATPAASRTISAQDALLNQPHDNPALQEAISNILATLIGSIDGSSWVLKDKSRSAQGWTLVYVCRQSVPIWKQEHSAQIVNYVSADFSSKEPDLILSSRPGFDCGGSITISFSRTGQKLEVKYDHMPLHITMSQLMDYFAPPPPMYPVSDTPAKSNISKSAKRRNQADGTPRSENPRKRAKVASSDEQAANGDQFNSGLDPSGLSTQDFDPTSRTSKAKRRKPRPKRPTIEGSIQDPTTALSVDPEETSRRHEHALRLLREQNIDPVTLSADQFETFANQAPDLQNESLEMFLQYGPEKLRIVHPEDEPEPPVDSVTPTAVTQKRRKSRTSTAAPGDLVSPNLPTPTGGSKRSLKPRISRGACSQCRESKTKCGREKPACSQCILALLQCSYPLEQKRPRKQDGQPADEPPIEELQAEESSGSPAAVSASEEQPADVDFVAHAEPARHNEWAWSVEAHQDANDFPNPEPAVVPFASLQEPPEASSDLQVSNVSPASLSRARLPQPSQPQALATTSPETGGTTNGSPEPTSNAQASTLTPPPTTTLAPMTTTLSQTAASSRTGSRKVASKKSQSQKHVASGHARPSTMNKTATQASLDNQKAPSPSIPHAPLVAPDTEHESSSGIWANPLQASEVRTGDGGSSIDEVRWTNSQSGTPTHQSQPKTQVDFHLNLHQSEHQPRQGDQTSFQSSAAPYSLHTQENQWQQGQGAFNPGHRHSNSSLQLQASQVPRTNSRQSNRSQNNTPPIQHVPAIRAPTTDSTNKQSHAIPLPLTSPLDPAQLSGNNDKPAFHSQSTSSNIDSLGQMNNTYPSHTSLSHTTQASTSIAYQPHSNNYSNHMQSTQCGDSHPQPQAVSSSSSSSYPSLTATAKWDSLERNTRSLPFSTNAALPPGAQYRAQTSSIHNQNAQAMYSQKPSPPAVNLRNTASPFSRHTPQPPRNQAGNSYPVQSNSQHFQVGTGSQSQDWFGNATNSFADTTSRNNRAQMPGYTGEQHYSAGPSSSGAHTRSIFQGDEETLLDMLRSSNHHS